MCVCASSGPCVVQMSTRMKKFVLCIKAVCAQRECVLYVCVCVCAGDRVVMVAGLECMCGGTHVKNTRDIKQATATKIKKVTAYDRSDL